MLAQLIFVTLLEHRTQIWELHRPSRDDHGCLNSENFPSVDLIGRKPLDGPTLSATKSYGGWATSQACELSQVFQTLRASVSLGSQMGIVGPNSWTAGKIKQYPIHMGTCSEHCEVLFTHRALMLPFVLGVVSFYKQRICVKSIQYPCILTTNGQMCLTISLAWLHADDASIWALLRSCF